MPAVAADSGLRGVVLVTVDSLRADALDAMPELCALADRGARFDRAFAAGNWTPFSFPSILGPEPVFVGRDGLGPASPTLAEHLTDAGVRTAGFNAANGFLTEHWGYDRGFDEFETWVGAGRWLAAHPTVQGWVQFAGWPVRRALDALRGEERHAADTSYLRAVEERADRFLATVAIGADGDEPFFLWCHLMDTHTPYVPAPRYVREVTDGRSGTLRTLRAHLRAGLGRELSERGLADLRSLYDAAARQVDDAIGRLLDRLHAHGLRDGTLVAVAGDHGEEFLEHGHLAHYPKLYDELVRVPLLVDDPRSDGLVVDRPVSLGSLPATVCDALDVDTTPFRRAGLLPAVQGNGGTGPGAGEPVCSVAVRGATATQQPIPRSLDSGDLLVAARDDRWTLVRNTATGERELYDRAVDPGEQEDIGDRIGNDAAVAELATAIDDHVAAVRADGDAPATDDGDRPAATDDRDGPDEPLDRQLAALGYR